MPKKLKGLSVHEVSGVDAAANRRTFLLAKAAKPTKRENGRNFPASAYAYVPDPKEPSTWKLRLIESPGAAPTAAQVGRAIAALGKGFRGKRVQIPSADRPMVKSKVLAAWRKTHPGETDIPPILKGATMATKNGANLLKSLAGLLGLNEGSQRAATVPLAKVSSQQLNDVFIGISDSVEKALDADSDEEKRATLNAIKGLLDKLMAGSDTEKDAEDGDDGDGDAEDDEGGDDPEEDDDDEGEGAEKDDLEMARKAHKERKAEREKKREEKRKKEEKGMKKSAVPEALQKQMDVLQKRAESAERIAKEERDLRLEGEYLAKAKGMGALPIEATKLAGMLKSIGESNPKQAAELERVLRAAGEGLAKGDLFKSYGSDMGGTQGGAMAEIEAKAAEIHKADPKLSKAKAIAKATEQNPDLYARLMGEKRSV